jgi:hypothetical protein
LGRVALEDSGGVGDVSGDFAPDDVCGNEGKGAGRIVLRTEVASNGLSLFKPHLERCSRVIDERVGKGKCR